LYGIASLQTYHYFNTFVKDRLLLKVFVAGLWIIDTFHSICITHAVYHYAIANYMNPIVLTNGVWSIDLSTVISTLIACACQMFFTARVWILGRNRLITGICGALCLVRFALSVVTTWASFNVLPYVRYEHEFTWSIKAGLAVATASDIIIAAAMVYYLLRSRSGIQKTDRIVSRLLGMDVISYWCSVETCLLTSIITTADLICTNVLTSLRTVASVIFLGVYFQVSKLYTNALLTS
ncbi:hypothetical protein FOMPIDRAFT_60029, partial [Fomitopsis schrenkii]